MVGSAAGDGLYLLARRDGSLVRRYPAAGSSVESEALVTDDRVYFADVGGSTWCYQLDGTLLWRHRGSAPTIVRPTKSHGLIVVTDVDDLAVALEADSGSLAWRYQHSKDLAREAELTLYAAPPAVVHDDNVLLGFSDGTLAGLDVVTGEVQWTERIGEGRYPDLVAEPTPHGTDLYTSGYYRPLVALDMDTQEVRWRVDHGGASAAVIDTRQEPATVYHPGSNGTLRAISSLTGAERWAWESGNNGALTSPVITEAGLVVASSQGGVYMVDPDNGNELWRYHEQHLLQGVSSAPMVDGKQLFFVSNAGWLYSFVVP
jgi:outer membrane protein assembly factor BamB